MEAEPPKAAPPNRKRRWFQFQLGSFVRFLRRIRSCNQLVAGSTTEIRQSFGRLQVNADTVIRFQGRRYRVGVHGVRAIQLVVDMANTADQETTKPLALLAYRGRIRDVTRAVPRAVLAHIAERERDPARRRLAIWLRGRCRGTLGTLTFGHLWSNADPHLRKELTRAFKRMDAWDYLRRIEEADPDPRIRRIARQPGPRSFDGRLANFLRGVMPHSTPKCETGLYLHDEVELTSGRPAKSIWLIRRLLEHIRQLVHGPRESALHRD
jgi:hypothetical protein